MSGWSYADRNWALNYGNHYPARNNISVFGTMPVDEVPNFTRSKSLAHAHMKSLRLFRKYCRYMPMIIHWNGMRKHTSVE